MKAKAPTPATAKKSKVLTPAIIAQLKPGPNGNARRVRDSKGLYIQIAHAPSMANSISRSWIFRYFIRGQSRHVGLGPYPEVSIADARALASQWRAKLKSPDPVDPLIERDKAKAALAAQIEQERKDREHTFGSTAEAWFAKQAKKWTHDGYRRQVWQLVEKWCRPVRLLNEDDVMRVLEPVWNGTEDRKATPETGARLRMYLEDILSFAAAPTRKWRDPSVPNPARWADNLEHVFTAPRQERHPARPGHALRRGPGIRGRASC
jgi:Arm DNA-binding domain